MRVLVQLRHSPSLAAAAAAGEPTRALALGAEPLAPGFTLDGDYEPVLLPTPVADEQGANPFALAQPLDFSLKPEVATYLVRGQVADADVDQSVQALTLSNPDVIGVFSDPVIERCICPERAIGTHQDVARVLGVQTLANRGLNGRGVPVAVVDSGINRAHLVTRGQNPRIDARKSWSPAGVTSKPGRHPVDHGTMVAFDIGITAPRSPLLDYALLLSTRPGPTVMAGYLSDAVAAYGKLLRIVRAVPANRRRLVVNNSWGMFSPSWDFPIGHPGNYSNNPAHPFNVIVASLERQGADILFAAGNCGRECPDGRCEFRPNQRPVCGANSHPKVLSVAGIDHRKRRIGYSSQGPGRLSPDKPDISAYTAFKGSLVFPGGDGGTSAACPVAAGVVAALRTKYPPAKVSPAELRSLVYKTADDLGGGGYDHNYGWGAIDPVPLADAVATAARRRRG
jgi:subtilisin family serine protease